ncbi:hypothetical protein GGS21DRAFT_485835 [Xylaria nigripes]|nr:hypothetical protein GGS21DRAFT_485835 [Xylaria nigripes]
MGFGSSSVIDCLKAYPREAQYDHMQEMQMVTVNPNSTAASISGVMAEYEDRQTANISWRELSTPLFNTMLSFGNFPLAVFTLFLVFLFYWFDCPGLLSISSFFFLVYLVMSLMECCCPQDLNIDPDYDDGLDDRKYGWDY